MTRRSRISAPIQNCSTLAKVNSRRVGQDDRACEGELQTEAVFLHAYAFAFRAAQVHAAAAVAVGAVSQFEREDVVQEGLMACWRALPHYNSNRASLRTFVERVVAAHLISLRRARHRRPQLEAIEHNQYPDRSASTCEDIELRVDIQRVLDALPESDRQLALLLHEHTPTEVSRIVGIARSTVYERISHVRVAFVEAGLRPQGAPRS